MDNGLDSSPSLLSEDTILRATSISKTFGATRALRNVSLDVRRAEIHGLLGENGAGKSTLVKILSGAVERDAGRIDISDTPDAHFASPSDAVDKGIAVVHQELSLLPNLTVLENLALDAPPVREGIVGSKLGVLDWSRMSDDVAMAARFLGDDRSHILVSNLSFADRQLVEIARALSRSARLIILDEPTSALAPGDRLQLFERLERQVANGVGIVLITHSLEEAVEHCHRITVLRDGKNVGTRNAQDTTIDELVELMTGKPSGEVYPAHEVPSSSDVRLRVRNLSSGQRVKDVTLEVGSGEIVGLAGLVGSGRSETLNALFGSREIDGGEIELDGQPLHVRDTRSAIRQGIALIPEDRRAESLFLQETVPRNIAIAAVNGQRGEPFTTFNGGLLRSKTIRDYAARMISELNILVGSVDARVDSVSGGNQQKVILGRWLATDPLLLLADEPTRGIAVGSKLEIYRHIRMLADKGTSVLVVSSEFDELVGLADRIILIKDGITYESIEAADVRDGDALLHRVLALSLPGRRGHG